VRRSLPVRPDLFATKDYLDTYSVMRPNLSTLADAVTHIDHIVKLVGIDHVGIGSDWDGISTVPPGSETCPGCRTSPPRCSSEVIPSRM